MHTPLVRKSSAFTYGPRSERCPRPLLLRAAQDESFEPAPSRSMTHEQKREFARRFSDRRRTCSIAHQHRRRTCGTPDDEPFLEADLWLGVIRERFTKAPAPRKSTFQMVIAAAFSSAFMV